ncbi:hypothetical protein ACIQC7_35335 [Kitasatospora sp. NPDC088556]|uniref:hypothetical protein n=1 Tax=Kitasatospora sp. NPDC088556 TaxID=3364076 RepID=UPI00380061B7
MGVSAYGAPRAAAIQVMDAAEGIPGCHSSHEQAAVECAKVAYTQALADLLRGEGPST